MNSAEKRARMRRSVQYCVYCGSPANGRDHVPPKGIFGDLLKERPSLNLDTVPSCNACNFSYAEDDTYFRDVMYLFAQRYGVAAHTAPIHAAIVRSARHAGGKFKTPIEIVIKGGRSAWRSTGAQGILTEGTEFGCNWTRIKRVMERTARGLYWIRCKQRVPNDFEVIVQGDKECEEFTPGQLERWTQSCQSVIRAYRRHVHLSAFSYGIKFLADDARAAMLSFIVYRVAIFLVLIRPKQSTRIVLP